MANDKPRVCVVVPVLNEVRYIRESLDSLTSQDYQPLEIIVYDAGSTDGTLDILKSYPVEVIVEPGLGQMAAINRGWRRTSAEFVTWWAGDDRYKPGAIRRLVEELQAHPEVGFVHADADVIDEHGLIIWHKVPGDIQLRDLVTEFSMVPQTVLIRRSALERSGMMDESRRFAADWDLFLRLAQYYPTVYAPLTAAEWRVHAGSEDRHNLERVGEAAIDVLDRFFERSDLTVEQRALRADGTAGSRLFAGGCYLMAGNRRQAWRMLFRALGTRASQLFRTRTGMYLLVGLLVPIGWRSPLRFRGLKRAIRKAFPCLIAVVRK